MSATHNPSRPGALDAFYTPDEVAEACVGTLGGALRGMTVLEPHAGGGAFVRAAMAAGADPVWAMDINPQAPALAPGGCLNRMCGDFLHEAPIGPGGAWGGPGPDWIIGNPPFNEAEAHVRRALGLARYGVGFLLRLAFLEGAKRRDFWREHPPERIHVLVNRPRFTGGGTDSAAYAWFVWDKDCIFEPSLRWLDWRRA